MDFVMRKRIVTAREAEELGLVHEVVDDAEGLDEAVTSDVGLGKHLTHCTILS